MARSPQKARTPSAKVHPFFKPKGLTADQLYAQLQQAVAQFGRELAAAGVPMPEHFAVSATKREGREALLGFIESQMGDGPAHLPRV